MISLKCKHCGNTWRVPRNSPAMNSCPTCGGHEFEINYEREMSPVLHEGIPMGGTVTHSPGSIEERLRRLETGGPGWG